MKTFRIRADAIFEAHGLFHAFGLLIAYFAQCRAGNSPTGFLARGSIEVLPTHPRQKLGPSVELRSLRLWHWRKAMHASRAAEDGRTSRHSKHQHEKDYNVHMLAVQALNDCFPLGDYAEADDEMDRLGLRRGPTS